MKLTDDQKNTVAGCLTSLMAYATSRGVTSGELRRMVAHSLEFTCALADGRTMGEAAELARASQSEGTEVG